jgi:hypothetical protein
MKRHTTGGDSPSQVRGDDVRPDTATCDLGCPRQSPGCNLVVASDYALPDATMTLLASIIVDQAERLKKTEAA